MGMEEKFSSLWFEINMAMVLTKNRKQVNRTEKFVTLPEMEIVLFIYTISRFFERSVSLDKKLWILFGMTKDGAVLWELQKLNLFLSLENFKMNAKGLEETKWSPEMTKKTIKLIETIKDISVFYGLIKWII